jgi:hypothetical protein
MACVVNKVYPQFPPRCRAGVTQRKVLEGWKKSLPNGQPVGKVKEVPELPGSGCNSHRLGRDAQKRYFIAKTEEFLEHLRVHELVGREEYEEQIRQSLQKLERSRTIEELQRITNEICLKVTIACYALRACMRVKKRKKPGKGEG